jgi:hypothetical protein
MSDGGDERALEEPMKSTARHALVVMLICLASASAPAGQRETNRPAAASDPLTIVRMFGDAAGETHLQTIELPLDNRAARSDVLRGPGNVQFARFAATMNADWHTTDRRKYLVTLSGAGYEIEVSDGTRMQFKPGSILLADDMKSKGHKTRALGGESLVMFVETDDLPAR